VTIAGLSRACYGFCTLLGRQEKSAEVATELRGSPSGSPRAGSPSAAGGGRRTAAPARVRAPPPGRTGTSAVAGVSFERF